MRSLRPTIGGFALAAVTIVVGPASAAAQVELVPAIGFYNPIGGWTQQEDDGTGYPPLRRQLGTAIFALRLSVPLSSRVAVQAGFGVTPSQVAVSTASGTVDINAGVYLGSARVQFTAATFTDGPKHDRVRWDFLLGLGAAVVHRAGTAWENTSGVTAPALVLEGGFAVGMFRLMLEDYVSWAQFNGGQPNQTRARMHHDLVGSFGFTLKLGGDR
jgi:hypothetical protein